MTVPQWVLKTSKLFRFTFFLRNQLEIVKSELYFVVFSPYVIPGLFTMMQCFSPLKSNLQSHQKLRSCTKCGFM